MDIRPATLVRLVDPEEPWREVVNEAKALTWTHPRPTGPSDHDRNLLRMLGQSSSVVYEMFGDAEGTRYRAQDRKVTP
jgi:hypothetical protein